MPLDKLVQCLMSSHHKSPDTITRAGLVRFDYHYRRFGGIGMSSHPLQYFFISLVASLKAICARPGDQYRFFSVKFAALPHRQSS